MGVLVINTNSASTEAQRNTSIQMGELQKVMRRISSGIKIASPADDAGGLAVATKMQAAMKRTEKVNSNIQNALSFLQTQDGGLSMAGKILDRVSELKTLYLDITKTGDATTGDKLNYELEYQALCTEFTNVLTASTFNGVALFGAASPGTVRLTEDGNNTATLVLDAVDLVADAAVTPAILLGTSTLANITVAQVNTAIAKVANFRATNGAAQSRLGFSSEMLSINKGNLEAAISRIVDADVAEESSRLAKHSVLSQAATAMLGQANSTPNMALQLLR